MEKARGYYIRSRAQWLEEGGKNTRYFLSLENKTQQDNCIYSLKTANGKTLNHNNDILEETVNFYSNLYSSKKPCKKSITCFIKDVHFSHTLNEDKRESCEGSITTQECLKVIK